MFPEEENRQVFYTISICALFAFFVFLRIMWTVCFFVNNILINGPNIGIGWIDDDQEEMAVFDVESQSRK